jgi:recombination associated protein RdgC
MPPRLANWMPSLRRGRQFLNFKDQPMFKNIQVFNIAPEWVSNLPAMELAFANNAFVECGGSQERSLGWVEPRGEKHGLLVESIGGQLICKMMVETKVLPGSVVKEEADKRAQAIEDTTGRKPGKKEKKEISEDVRTSLLPMAFTKKSAAFVWIDLSTRYLIVEAGSRSRSDDIISLLVKSLEGFAVTHSQTKMSPSAAMSVWLNTQELPAGFTADRDCVLKATDDSKASVRYDKHALDIDEIRSHIEAGKVPVQLAMTWDSRVSFVLTDNGTLKKIAFCDTALEQGTTKGKDSGFDADVAIVTGELCKLLPDLFEALGGAVEMQVVQEKKEVAEMA